MSENTGQEKTEQATTKRLEEAANKGQVAYSKELTDAFLFIGIILYVFLFGGALAANLGEVMRRALRFEDMDMVNADGIFGLIQMVITEVGQMVLPLFGGVSLIVILGGVMQVGVKISGKRIEPKPDKLDPIKGVKKIFSVKSVMTVLTQALKLIAVATVTLTVISGVVPFAGNLASRDPILLVWLFPDTILEIGFKVGILLLFLAVADLMFQRWKHAKDMKMTKQEVKDENKQSEGDPQIKSRVRQLQRERARARMMGDVKNATVVVRNPTHFAIALKYEPGEDAAPLVLAKGKNLIALRIIELAEEAGVPVRSDPPLARRIYPLVKVGRVIPEDLFRAVAQVLAWVYRKKGFDTFEAIREEQE